MILRKITKIPFKTQPEDDIDEAIYLQKLHNKKVKCCLL